MSADDVAHACRLKAGRAEKKDMVADDKQRILRAAHDVLVELGPLAPLDQIVYRADVDQEVFDRLFSSRERLIRAVVVDNMNQLAVAARVARAQHRDPWTAFQHFAHAVLDARLLALLLTFGSRARHDEQFELTRLDAQTEVGHLLAAARQAGMRDDVDVGDVVFFLSMITRPNPSVPADLDAKARKRLLGVVLDGLRVPQRTHLTGEPISADELDMELVTAMWSRMKS